MTRRRPSPEAEARRIAAVREANANREPSEETKRKMSVGIRAAWARRRANGTAHYKTTEATRAAKAERLRAILENPEIEAKRVARSQARLSEVRKTAEFGKAVSRGIKAKMAADPEFAAFVHANMERMNSDPDILERAYNARLEVIRTPEFRARLSRNAKKPANMAKREASKTKAQDAKRGFKVPYHLRKEYQRLTIKQKLRPREAGVVLGLLSP